MTQYQFTGQYAYTDDILTTDVTESFGLMFYNARWLDVSTGRFAQADSLVPGGVQGLDRYAYVNNSPVVYVDPSGHLKCKKSSANAAYANVAEGDCEDRDTAQILQDEYGIILDQSEREFSKDEISVIYAAVRSVGVAFTRELIGMTASAAFQQVYGLLTFKRVYRYEYDGNFYDDGACACGGANTIQFASFYQTGPYRSSVIAMEMNRNLVVHELGHLYYHGAAGVPALAGLSRNALIPNPCNGCYYWQQHPPSMNDDGNDIPGELFGDSFLAWVFDAWNTDPEFALAVDNAQNAMDNIAQNALVP
jgi:RHS repeat-associated protein